MWHNADAASSLFKMWHNADAASALIRFRKTETINLICSTTQMQPQPYLKIQVQIMLFAIILRIKTAKNDSKCLVTILSQQRFNNKN